MIASPSIFLVHIGVIMIIEIHNRDLAEQQALAVALGRISNYEDTERVDLYATPRLNDGWLEYGIKYKFKNSGTLYVAMIQRKPEAEYEFHS